MEGPPTMKKRFVTIEATGRKVELYQRPKTGRLVPCPGSAHSNPYIDHCMLCMPRWGQVEEESPIDLAAARNAGQVVPYFNELDEEDMLKAGAKLVGVREERRGCTSFYNVFMWEEKGT